MEQSAEKPLKVPQRLLNRDFLLLWQGQTVSQFGNQAFIIAQVFWIKHATDSASLMGLLLMISSLTAVLLGPIGGTIADNYSRRKIIIVSDLLSGLAVLALSALMFSTTSVPLTLGALFIVSVLLAAISAIFLPAINASIPSLVPNEKLNGANSLFQMSLQLAQFFGQAAGGTLFRILGAPVLFFIDGITFIFSAATESLIAIPQSIPERSPGWRTALRKFRSDLVEGLRYIWQQAGLRELVLVSALLNFFMAPVLLLLPFYVEDYLQRQPDWYGYLVATFGLGSLLGFLLAGALPYRAKTRGRLISLFIVAQPFGYIVLGLLDNVFLALPVILVGGLLQGFVIVNIASILQATTPENIRGRVFGLLATISAALSPLGMGVSGVVADLVDQNIPLIYIASGVIAVLLSMFIIVRPDLQKYLAYAAEEELPQPMP